MESQGQNRFYPKFGVALRTGNVNMAAACRRRPLLGYILARSNFQMYAFMSLQVFNNLKQVIRSRVSL